MLVEAAQLRFECQALIYEYSHLTAGNSFVKRTSVIKATVKDLLSGGYKIDNGV
jgi:hypothetical protein